MKLIKGIKCKGRPYIIPDCSRNDLPSFFKEMGYKVGAEIGVYRGKFAKRFAEIGLKIYAIDPWKPYFCSVRKKDSVEREEYFYNKASGLLSRYKNVSIIRKTSMDALKDFKDESLDFVYIDAIHSLKYVVEDLDGWSKKIRKGGIVSGHDYVRRRPREWESNHVKFAVDAYVGAYRIKNWYILGSNEYGQKRDRCRSFMWIK